MDTVYQLMMGISLAACCGVRATLPMFVVGILARTGHLQLGSSYAFLSSDAMLIILAIASVMEFLGDKVIAIDHFLDAVGTLARPIAGMILTSSVLTKIDPQTAMMLGIITGGATALTLHAGKAATRVKATMLAPFHGGTVNAALSLGEDALVVGGVLLSAIAPVLAFFLATALMAAALVMVYLGLKAGQKLFSVFVPPVQRVTVGAQPQLTIHAN